jgi:hypothetical protein
MMIVCANCLVEMRCRKTSSSIRYNDGNYVYPADQFNCPKCGIIVNVANGMSYYDPNPPERSNGDVWMDI